MAEEPNKPTEGKPPEKPADRPDPNVKPPDFVEVTEGFDPSKILYKDKGTEKGKGKGKE